MKKIFFLLIASIGLGATAFSQIPTNGLFGWWPFTGNANDSSGNGNHGTVNGATLTTDRNGAQDRAYNFDGISNYIDVGSSPVFVNFDSATFSFWYSPEPHPNYEADVVFSNFNKDAVGSGYQALILGVEKKLVFSYRINPDTGIYYTATDTIACYSVWNHVVITYLKIGSTATSSLFINGELDTTATLNNPIDFTNTSSMKFGTNIDFAFERFFKGKIDDIGMWSRVLTQQEVFQLYTSSSCTDTTHISIFDTTHVTVFDTTQVTTYDTVTTFTSVTDTLIIDAVLTGVNPPNNINTIKIYPNPAATHITIDNGNYNLMQGYTLRIDNSLGQTVFTSLINQQQFSVNLSTWSGNGTYFVYVIDAQQAIKEIKKIILQ